MKLTVDSNDPLDDAIRVLGAVYGVTLMVATEDKPDTPARTRTRARRTTNSKTKRGSRSKATGSVGGADATSAREPNASQPLPITSASGASRNAEVRAWARKNGYTLSDRGRVPAAVLNAYTSAHTS